MKNSLPNNNYNNSLVVLIAGSSTRFSTNGTVKKQFLLVHQKPLFIHTLENLTKSNVFNSVVVVCQEEFRDDVKSHIAKYCEHIKNIDVIIGGADRVGSVYNAMRFLHDRQNSGGESNNKTDYVFIHDGVRPIVSIDEICLLAQSVIEHNAAILAMPMTDTVKQVDKNGMIVQTLDRSVLYRAATPQAFEFTKYYNAISKCIDENKTTEVTDDAQIYSMYDAKGNVAIVPCSSKNIKITTQDDITLVF